MGLISHRFLSVMVWVASCIMQAAGGTLIAGVVLGGLGLALTLGSLALLLDLIGHMQAGTEVPISIRGVVLVANAGFVASALVIGGFGLAGAGCQYLGERLGLRAARCFLANVRSRIAQGCQQPSSDPVLAQSTLPTIASIVHVISRESALAALQVTRLPVAMVTALCCVGLMLVWAPRATVIIAMFAPVYILTLGALNRRAKRIHAENSELNDLARQNLAATLGNLETTNAATDSGSLPGTPAALARTDAIIFERIAVVRKVAFLNGLTLTVLIVTVLLLVRGGAFGAEFDWATLIVFLVLLRFAAGALEQIAVASNVISRFLPSVELARTLDQTQPASRSSDGADARGPARILAVLSNRPNRLSTLRGAMLLAKEEPCAAPGSLSIRLEDHDGPRPDEPAVAHDAKALINSGGNAPELGVLVIAGRSAAQLKRLEAAGIVPDLVADLRSKPERLRGCRDVIDERTEPAQHIVATDTGDADLIDLV